MTFDPSGIEEAQIIPETKDSADDDLLQRMAKQTEIKTPGTSEEKKITADFWDASEDDFTEPEPKKDTKTNTAAANEKETQASVKTEKKLDDKSYHNSAANATFFIEFATEGLCTMAVNRKFKKRFTREENEMLPGVEDADPKDLTEPGKALQSKYFKLVKKKEILLEKMPFEKDEREIMEDAFFRLCKQRDIEIPPELAVVISVLTSVGSRALDISFD